MRKPTFKIVPDKKEEGRFNIYIRRRFFYRYRGNERTLAEAQKRCDRILQSWDALAAQAATPVTYYPPKELPNWAE